MPDFISPSNKIVGDLVLLSFGQTERIGTKCSTLRKLEIGLERQDNYINDAK